jgi:hypothetical protein
MTRSLPFIPHDRGPSIWSRLTSGHGGNNAFLLTLTNADITVVIADCGRRILMAAADNIKDKRTSHCRVPSAGIIP